MYKQAQPTRAGVTCDLHTDLQKLLLFVAHTTSEEKEGEEKQINQ